MLCRQITISTRLTSSHDDDEDSRSRLTRLKFIHYPILSMILVRLGEIHIDRCQPDKRKERGGVHGIQRSTSFFERNCIPHVEACTKEMMTLCHQKDQAIQVDVNLKIPELI